MENMNLAHWNGMIAMAGNEDLQAVYQNGNINSWNHLRAYARTIQSCGMTYAPRYIPYEEMEGIVTMPSQEDTPYPSACPHASVWGVCMAPGI